MQEVSGVQDVVVSAGVWRWYLQDVVVLIHQANRYCDPKSGVSTHFTTRPLISTSCAFTQCIPCIKVPNTAIPVNVLRFQYTIFLHRMQVL
jgi:hypothetical protein